MIITVIPIKGQYNGFYEWEFWVEGEEYSGLEKNYNSLFREPENGETLLIICISGLGVLLITFIGLCLYCCCRKQTKNNQVYDAEDSNGFNNYYNKPNRAL